MRQFYHKVQFILSQLVFCLHNKMNLDKPTLLNPHLGKISSPQMQKKVKEMIRKKAALYGIQELANPSFHSNHAQMFSSRLSKNKGHNMRSKSTLQSVPSTHNVQTHREKVQYDQEGQVIVKAAVVPSYKLDSKTNQQKLFPPLTSLKNLISDEKQIMYIFRDKLDYDINDIVFQYLKILQLAIAYESQMFSQKIVPHKGILIPTLEFLAESFLECQFNKIVLVFAVIGLELCEFYKQLDRVGKFLFTISKVLRKIEKYQECEVVLKKALEYVWFARRLHHQEGGHKKDKHNDHNNHNDHSNEHKDHDKHQWQTLPTTSHQKPSAKQPRIKHIPTQNMQHSSPNDPQTRGHHYQHRQHKRKLLFQQYTNIELLIYNELSYCLLQLNKKEESKIFGEKYEIGYLEKETSSSSVMQLSKDLIASAQKRIVAWQRVDKHRFDLIFGLELDKYLLKHGQAIKDKFQQPKFIKALKVNIDLLIDNLFKKDLFFYEVPLITEFKDTEWEFYKKSHQKLPVLTQKFVYKKKSLSESNRRASSIPVNMKKFDNQNVGGNKIFNYRGVGLSRTKLTTLFRDYIHFVQRKLSHRDKENHAKLLPVLNVGKNLQGVQKIKTNITEHLETHHKGE